MRGRRKGRQNGKLKMTFTSRKERRRGGENEFLNIQGLDQESEVFDDSRIGG